MSFIHGHGGGGGGKGKGGGGSSHDDTLRSFAHVKLVDAISEGPIEGLVNGADSIFINKTPITNVKEAGWQFRAGLPDDAPLAGVDQVEAFQNVGAEVNQELGPVVRTITDASIDAIKVYMTLNALFRVSSKGALKTTDSGWNIEIRAAGRDWTTAVNFPMKEKTTAPVQFEHTIEPAQFGPAPWDIRVSAIRPEEEDHTQSIMWAGVGLLTDGKMTYPHTALVGLALSSEHVGGSTPSRHYHIKGRKILVPTNYNPETREYTGIWNGTFKRVYSNNPAWVLYDMVENNVFGIGNEIEISALNKWRLYAIAQYCDGMVPSGYKDENDVDVLEPRYTFNGAITDKKEALDALRAITAVWRGMGFYSLNQFFVSADMPQDPAHIYGPANVVDGRFEYSGSSVKARHSVVMVRFNDMNNFAEPAVEPVIDDELLKRFGWREKTLELTGCTSRSLAHRYGRWVTDTEKSETETVTFSVGLDSLHALPGEVIAINDPRRAQARMAGRIMGVNGTTITFDKALDESVSRLSATVYVHKPDGTLSKTTVDLSADRKSAVIPDAEANWIGCTFIVSATNLTPRLYRIISVDEQPNNVLKLTALQYDPFKFARVEYGIEFEALPVTLDNSIVAPPSDLNIEERSYTENGGIRTDLELSWTPSASEYILEYRVYATTPSQSRVLIGSTSRPALTYTTTEAGDYEFRVVTVSVSGATSTPLLGAYKVKGVSAIAVGMITDLVNANTLKGGSNVTFAGRDVQLSWRNMMKVSSTAQIEEVESDSTLYSHTVLDFYVNGVRVRSQKVKGNAFTYTYEMNRSDAIAGGFGGAQRSFVVQAHLVDVTGRTSATTSINLFNPAPAAITPGILVSGNDLRISWDRSSDTDVVGYLVYVKEQDTPINGDTPVGSTVDNNFSFIGQTNTQYYISVAAFDAFGSDALNYGQRVPALAGSTALDDTPPDVPTGLGLISFLSDDGKAKLRASWNANSEQDMSRYDLLISEEGGPEISYLTSATVTSHEWTVVRGLTYRVRIRAVDQIGNASAYTAPITHVAVKDTVPPAKPTGLKAEAGFGAMWLTWSPNTETDLAVYQVYESETNVAPTAATEGLWRSTSTVFSRTGLTDDKRYYYWVRAIDTSGNASAWSNGVNAKTPASVAITAEDIAGIVDATAFAAGVRPIEVVTELPTEGNTEGRVVVLTSDGKLYRYTSGGWTASIPAADVQGQLSSAQIASIEAAKVSGQLTNDQIAAIAATKLTGQIVANQIADASLTAAKFAANNKPVETVSSLPGTPHVQGRVVLLTSDNQLYRNTGSGWTAAVPAQNVSGQLSDAQIAAVNAAKVAGQLTNAQIADIAASKLTGQVVASQIADAAVTTAKFAAGLKPVEIVSSLPSSGNSVGRVVVLTTDGKLYRYTSSGWSATVSSADIAGQVQAAQIAGLEASKITGQMTDAQIAAISAAKMTGQLTGAQIADAAITTAKFASSVKPVEVLSSLPGTPHVEGRVVYLTSDNKLYRNTGSGWTAAVASGDISGTMSSSQIASLDAAKLTGTIVEARLASLDAAKLTGTVNEARIAGLAASKVTGQLSDSQIAAVSAAKLAGEITAAQITAGATLKDQAVFTMDQGAPHALTNGSGSSHSFSTDCFSGSHAALISYSGASDPISSGTTGGVFITLPDYVAVNFKGKRVRISGYAKKPSSNGASGAGIAYSTNDNGNSGWFTFTPTSSWQKFEFFYDVPSPSKGEADILSFWGDTGNSGKRTLFDQWTVEVVADLSNAPGLISETQISDGSISTPKMKANSVTATVVAAGAITAGKIAANAVTANEIASNAVTAAKISAGAVVAGKIAADAVTANEIAANAVTAQQIAASAVVAGKIASNAVTATTIAADAVTADKIAANAVTAQAIAAGVITGDKLVANAITAREIAASTITASQIASNAITTAKIATNAVTANELSSNSVQATHLTANAVVAGKIAAGAVRAGEIAAGAITTEKLAVGSGVNLLSNTGFWGGLADWSIGRNGTAGSNTDLAIRKPGESWAGQTFPTLRLFQSGGDTSGYADIYYTPSINIDGTKSPGVPITVGETYEVSAYLSTHRCNAELRIQWFNATGATITYTGPVSMGPASGSSDSPDTWTRLVVRGTAPSGAVKASLHLRKLATLSGSTDSFLFLHKPQLAQTVPNATEAVPYSTGGMTMIDGGQILTNTITSRHIVANSITATEIASGTITATQIASNAITSSKIVANAVTATELASNAVQATHISAGAVVAGKIAANAVTASEIASNSITSAKIAAGAVTATEIAAGSISASKLAIGDTSNIFPDPDMLEPSIYSGVSLSVHATGESGTGTSKQYLRIPAGTKGEVLSPSFQVEDGKPYFISATCEMNGSGSGTADISVRWYSNFAATTAVSTNFIGNTSSTSWGVRKGVFTAPSGARRARLIFAQPVSGATRNAHFGEPVVRRAANGELIVDGAITADKIAANSVNASHIVSNSITANEIAANAITASELATNAVTATHIVAGTITANELASNSVTTAKVATNAITANELASNSVQAGHITAGAITAGKIAAGSITATEMAANSITAKQLVLTDFTNVVLNGQFATGDESGWSTLPSGVTIVERDTSAGDNAQRTIPTPYAMCFANTSSNGPYASTGSSADGGSYADCMDGDKFSWTVETAFGGTNPDGALRIYAYWLKKNGSVTNNYADISAASTSWGTKTGTFTAPTDATGIRIRIHRSATTNSGRSYVTNITVRKMHGANMIVDGAITSAKIATNAVTANEIASNTITAANIASGTITGSRIAGRTITGSNIVSNTITATEIAADTITATQIKSNTLTANEIAANAITASELASNSVQTGHITAGAVTADQIAARAITASKIGVMDLENLWPDGTWESRDSNFFELSGTSVNQFWSTVAVTGNTAFALQKTSLGQSVNAKLLPEYAVSVKAGDVFYAEVAARVMTTSISAGFYYRLRWLNSSRDEISYTDVVGNSGLSTGWTTFTKQVTAPSNARYVKWQFYNHDTQDTNETIYIDRVVLRRANGGEMIVDGSIKSNHLVTNEAVITGTAQIANATITEAKISGTLNANKITAGTTLSNSITVNGTSLNNIETWADNPAARINAASTKIDPGKITISGSTTLANWQKGGDTTKIDGGAISANTISANKLEIGSRNITLTGIEWEHNSPATNRADWTSGAVRWTNDSGSEVSTSIAAGSTGTWSSGVIYIYWVKGASSFSTTTTQTSAQGADRLIIATYEGGAKLDADYGRTIIDGTKIKAGTVQGSRIAGNTITADKLDTNSLQVQGLSIFGGELKSTNFNAGSQGWRIGIGGAAEFSDVVIRRQIEVAAGTINVGTFTAAGTDNGSSEDLWVSPEKRRFLKTSPVAISAWGGAKRTYLATAGMTGVIIPVGNTEPDVYWGWDARVLPLTRWSGDQTLRVCFDFWQRNVFKVENCVIHWKIYEVS